MQINEGALQILDILEQSNTHLNLANIANTASPQCASKPFFFIYSSKTAFSPTRKQVHTSHIHHDAILTTFYIFWNALSLLQSHLKESARDNIQQSMGRFVWLNANMPATTLVFLITMCNLGSGTSKKLNCGKLLYSIKWARTSFLSIVL